MFFIVAAAGHDDVVVLIRGAIGHFIIIFAFAVELIIYLDIGKILTQHTFFVKIFIFLHNAFGFEDGHANEIISVVRFKWQCGDFFAFLVIVGDKVVGVPGGVLHFYETNDVFREGIVVFDNAFFTQCLGVIWF